MGLPHAEGAKDSGDGASSDDAALQYLMEDIPVTIKLQEFGDQSFYVAESAHYPGVQGVGSTISGAQATFASHLIDYIDEKEQEDA